MDYDDLFQVDHTAHTSHVLVADHDAILLKRKPRIILISPVNHGPRKHRPFPIHKLAQILLSEPPVPSRSLLLRQHSLRNPRTLRSRHADPLPLVASVI